MESDPVLYFLFSELWRDLFHYSHLCGSFLLLSFSHFQRTLADARRRPFLFHAALSVIEAVHRVESFRQRPQQSVTPIQDFRLTFKLGVINEADDIIEKI